MKARRVATLGILTAVALLLSYVERMLPLDFGVPGIKPGLANIAVLVTLYTCGGGWAAAVSLARVGVMGLLFGGFSGMLYSFAGAVCALFAMLVMKRAKVFGLVGVSTAGAAAHIVGQLLAASALMGKIVWIYAPFLMLSAVVTGVFNGAVSALVVRRIEKVL